MRFKINLSMDYHAYSSHQFNLGIVLTPPRQSEINEKKLEHVGKAIFEVPFMIQSYAESMKKIMGAL